VYSIRGENNEYNLWRQPLDGKPGSQISHFPSEQISALTGRRTAKKCWYGGASESDVVLLRDTSNSHLAGGHWPVFATFGMVPVFIFYHSSGSPPSSTGRGLISGVFACMLIMRRVPVTRWVQVPDKFLGMWAAVTEM